MNTIAEKHEQAMQWAEAAFVARRHGHLNEAHDLSCKAYALERDAAEALRDAFHEEPSRSVLFRSAATLALWCDRPGDALALAEAGLRGNPPDAIAGELREVARQVASQPAQDIAGSLVAADAPPPLHNPVSP